MSKFPDIKLVGEKVGAVVVGLSARGSERIRKRLVNAAFTDVLAFGSASSFQKRAISYLSGPDRLKTAESLDFAKQSHEELKLSEDRARRRGY